MFKALYIIFWLLFGVAFLLSFIVIGLKIFHKMVDGYQKWIKQEFIEETFFIERYDSGLLSFLFGPLFTYLLLIGFSLASLIMSFLGQSVDYSYATWFMTDIVFQVASAGLILFLARFYPLIKFDAANKERPLSITKPEMRSLKAAFSKSPLIFMFRLGLCAFGIGYFISWMLGLYSELSGRNIFSLIIPLVLVLNILVSIFRLLKSPDSVYKESCISLAQWFMVISNSIFILVPLVPLTMFTAIYLGLDEEKTFVGFLSPLMFILFNILLAYVEYKMLILYRKK